MYLEYVKCTMSKYFYYLVRASLTKYYIAKLNVGPKKKNNNNNRKNKEKNGIFLVHSRLKCRYARKSPVHLFTPLYRSVHKSHLSCRRTWVEGARARANLIRGMQA